MKIPQLQKKPELKSCHNKTWKDNYSWIHQPNILDVLKDSSKLSPEVRKYLEAGNSITPIDALKMFGSFRLAAIICNLKKDLDWMTDKEIVTTMVRNEFGVKFGSYKIKWYKKPSVNEFEMKRILKYNNMKALGQVE